MRRFPGRATAMMLPAVAVPLVVSVLAPIARLPDHGDDAHPAFDRHFEERLFGGAGAPRHEQSHRGAEGGRNDRGAAGGETGETDEGHW